MSTCQRNN